MKRDLKALGARVHFLRRARGLSLSELGEKAGVSKSYLSLLENGEDVNPTLEVLLSIAKSLGATLADVLEEPKTRTRRVEIPSELPAGLRELIDERRKAGSPIDESTIFWLAHAEFRGDRPKTKQDFEYLLRSLQFTVGRDGR